MAVCVSGEGIYSSLYRVAMSCYNWLSKLLANNCLCADIHLGQVD